MTTLGRCDRVNGVMRRHRVPFPLEAVRSLSDPPYLAVSRRGGGQRFQVIESSYQTHNAGDWCVSGHCAKLFNDKSAFHIRTIGGDGQLDFASGVPILYNTKVSLVSDLALF
jgi:hypothetical protein